MHSLDGSCRSLAVERFLDLVLGAADGVLHLAFHLIGLAFALQLGVAGHFAGGLLHLTLGLFEAAFDTVLVHCFLACWRELAKTTRRWRRVFRASAIHAHPP